MSGNELRIQGFRYILVGGLTNILVYGIFVFLRSVFPSSNPTVDLLLATFLVMPMSYLLNRKWVFKSEVNAGAQMQKFFIVYASGALIGLFVSHVLWQLIPIDVRITQAFSMILVAVGSFTLQKIWTFASNATS